MAQSLQFVTLDVFTTKRFEGNSLAVVFLSPSSPISQAQKQLVATEFNYSETIFVHPESSDQNQPRKIDIFTTDQELPFAGHPTIGAASWLLLHSQTSSGSGAGRSSAIATKAGDIPISISTEDPNRVSASIPHNVHIHSNKMPLSDILKHHPSLKQHIHAEKYADGFPIVSIVKGMTAVHVRLPNLEALAAVTTSTGGVIPETNVDEGGYLDVGWEGHVSTYFYVRDVWDDKLGAKVIRSRMMLGNLEDPATGSAASGLASYISLTEPETVPKVGTVYQVVQGVEMGKRSEIGLKFVLKDGGKEIENIQLEGSAVKVSEGSIFVSDE